MRMNVLCRCILMYIYIYNMYVCESVCTLVHLHVHIVARSILTTPPKTARSRQVWSGGMGLVFLLHVQADVAIFLLVWLEDQRKARRRNADATD